MQRIAEKGTDGSPGCCRGTCWGLRAAVHGEPGSALLTIRVPGGWCPARQQTACLRGAKVEW